MEEDFGNMFPEDNDDYNDDQRGKQKHTVDVIRDDEERSEDEDDEDHEGAAAVDKNNPDGPAAGNDIKQKKKTRRKVAVFRFKPDMLTNQDRGIKCLYENVAKAKIFDQSEKGPMEEIKTLDKLMKYYKEWHFHFMPKYSFDFFLDRCSHFSKNNLVKTYLTNVRRIHKEEMKWEDLLNDLHVDADTTTNVTAGATAEDTSATADVGSTSTKTGATPVPAASTKDGKAGQKQEEKNYKVYYFPADQKPKLSGAYQSRPFTKQEPTKESQSGKKPAPNNKKHDSDEPDDYDEDQYKIDQYEAELQRIEKEFGANEDDYIDPFYNDDLDDISLKKIQKS